VRSSVRCAAKITNAHSPLKGTYSSKAKAIYERTADVSVMENYVADMDRIVIHMSTGKNNFRI
jgi:hypothetical protein